MPSSKEYFDYISEQLSGLEDIAYRKMMGEYIIYYKGKIVGGIYDNRLLLKTTRSANELIPNAKYELPYEGAKEMLLIENVDEREYLEKLIKAIEPELPSPKKKSKQVK